MPFDAVRLVNNFEGLFVPGLGTLRYQECASALFELLPQLIPVTNPEIHAKLCSVRVESKNGYDLFWRILELTVPAFDPTVPLEAPGWDHDADILDFSRRYELYFRLQAKKQVYFNTCDRTTMFLKAIASTTYTNIATSLQSNIDSYRHPDDEYFLPQKYLLTNIAMLIHTHTKSQARDLGLRRVNKVAGWDSMSDVLLDDELHYCHIQGYQPRALRVEQGRGSMGQGGAQNFQRRPRFGNRQDRSTLSMDRSSSTNSTLSSDRSTTASRGRFARPDQRRCTFLPGVQCDACKRIGHEAINCNMLALALFIERHKQSLSDTERNEIESKWIVRWKECLGQPARTPRQLMHTYCNVMNITPDTLNLAMDWECWPELESNLADE